MEMAKNPVIQPGQKDRADFCKKYKETTKALKLTSAQAVACRRMASRLYKTEKRATGAKLSRELAAAEAANLGPCSIQR